MNEPTWIGADTVRAIHTRQIMTHGGDSGLRDQGLLESALARPKHIFADESQTLDLARLAAAYAFGIVKNHAFVDGNKRTAHVTYRLFLRLNGADIDATAQEKYVAMYQLAAGELTEDQFADWLPEHRVDNSEST